MDLNEALEKMSLEEMLEALKDPESIVSQKVARRLAEDCKFVVESFKENHPIGDRLEMFVGLKYGSAMGTAGSMSTGLLEAALDAAKEAKRATDAYKGRTKEDTIQ